MAQITRRSFLASSALAASAAFATRVVSAAPAAEPVTPALIEAAKKEGKLAFYTAMDLPVGEKFARAFETKYPGIAVRVERSGAERVFQRIGQEMTSNIHAVDVVNTADGAHVIVWKREGWLAPYVPEDMAQHFPAQYHDPDGMSALTRVWLCSLGYNTNLVKPEDAPKSFADLLDPKWAGKMVKAHPAYSGTIMTATFQIARDLGWGYLEKLAKQKIMQVQSSTDPPKKLALGERAVMADGNDYNLIQLKERGQPVEVVYPTEGTPFVVRSDRDLQVRAEPERRAAVPELSAFARGPAVAGRLRAPAFGARSGRGKARRREAHRHQAVEGRRGRRRARCRGDQGALCEDFRGVMRRPSYRRCRVLRPAPSPLEGEGWGGGSKFVARSIFNRLTPTPNPSPQGGGEQTGARGTL